MHWHSIYDHTQQQSEKKLTDSSSSVGSEDFSTPFSTFPIDLKKKVQNAQKKVQNAKKSTKKVQKPRMAKKKYRTFKKVQTGSTGLWFLSISVSIYSLFNLT